MLDQAADATELLAASPYITEGRLFARCDPSVARLYTAFNALNFISGASKLSVLKKLLTVGVKLYHVESLHAKVVLVDGQHFTLGSQNLTIRGRRINKEASFLSGHESPGQEVRDFFDEIHKYARLITLEDILKMEELIDPWIPKFKKVERGAREIDQEIEKARLEREEADRVRRLAEARERIQQRKDELLKNIRDREEKEAITRMTQALDRLRLFADHSRPAARSSIYASVSKPRHSDRHSLIPVDRDSDFRGLLGAVGVRPKQFSRYLLINVDNGKLALVRYAKTQWSFFGSGVHPGKKLEVGGLRWDVKIEFDWTPEGSIGRNGVIRLFHPTNIFGENSLGIVAGFMFTVEGVELVNLEIDGCKVGGKLGVFWDPSKIDRDEVEAGLRAYIMNQLTKPFKYSQNLYGKDAHQFLETLHPVKYRVQAHRLADTAILTVRQYPLMKRKATVSDILLRPIGTR